jgi:excisionase family DNA binding protein
MPRTKKQPEPTPQPLTAPMNGGHAEVLTLSEASAYLRISESEVLRLHHEQGLPGRQVGPKWRFYKGAIQQWLSTPSPRGSKEGIWAAAGSWKDDPFLDEMLKEIYRKRGRPMTEE